MQLFTKIYKFNVTLPILVAVIFTFIFSYFTVYRHNSFNSHAFDLGIYTQITYLYSQGLTPFSSLKHILLLADHFGPILILFAPIYKIFPTSTTLLIIQAALVSLSSIPIYLIAFDQLKNRLLSVIIVIVYLTSPGLLSAISFDFHLTTISIFPLSLILYAWYFQKIRFYWLCLFLSLFFKEDVQIFILGLGIFEIIQKQKRLGMATIAFALITFYIIKFQIMPFLWPGSAGFYISTLILPLNDPLSLILLLIQRPTIFLDQIFNSPVKISTIDMLYRPFSFLSFLSPLSWLTVFPYLFLRFSSNYIQMWGTEFHHNANLIPFLAVSAILAIKKYKLPYFPISLLLIFMLILGGLSPNSIIWSPLRLSYSNLSSFYYIEEALKTIPASAAVSAQSPIVPHLSNRDRIYLFPEVYGAEYIILDTSLGTYPMGQKELQNRINNLKNSPSWKINLENKSLIIFKQI